MKFSTLIIAAVVGLAQTTNAQDRDVGKVDFVKQIRPILVAHCYECHSSKKSESGLRLDLRRRAFAGGDQATAIVPGKPESSELLKRIVSKDDDRMPPTGEGKPLSKQQVELIRRWIQQGAHWPKGSDAEDDEFTKHWAWQPLSQPTPPDVKDAAWTENGIDAFILSRLEAKGIKPSPRASRETLIRRVYLDLLGLPPTVEDWRRWTTNDSPNWYEQMVDALLASPHFGERWGRVWLDQARYADSDGYEKDRPRPQAYLYRDWVIDAINEDLPFDQFSIQQIAGDLIPNATPKVVSATGFHRNTLTNNEGGIDREEDRVKQTIDRLNTTFTVWMGLTVQCAQCHTHKYDPISQREYYQLYSFFNDADEASVTLDPTRTQIAQYESAVAQHKATLADKKHQFETAKQRLKQEQPEHERRLLARFPNGEATPPKNGLVTYFTVDDLKELPSKSNAAGNPTLAEGIVGKALNLNGNGQHIQIHDGPVFHADQSFTCSAWFNPTDATGAILTKINEPNKFRGIDFTSHRGELEVHLVDEWPKNAIKVTAKTARLKPGQWQHVLFSYDGSRKAAGVNLFINGEKIEAKIHYDTLVGDFTTPDPWRIGRRKQSAYAKGLLDDIRIYDRVLNDAEINLVAGKHDALAKVLRLLKTPADRRNEKQRSQIESYFIGDDPEASALRKEIRNLNTNPPKVQRDTAMSIQQRVQPRETYVHVRGEFLNKGVKVDIGTPAFLPEIQARSKRLDRLDLANWMMDEQNSLTPRVYVNRVWQAYFGRGLVNTDADFGTQGNRPTHPGLLDWLAGSLVRRDWSNKELHRSIVLSATYRQSSKLRPELLEIDPNNELLARQNRLRITAESVRDLSLSVSGLLEPRLKGPSVFPPLPAGVIELAFVDVINRGPWKVSTGADRYRRGLYTFFQRTSPYPMLSLFDAPDSNVTCTRRATSNTPLQALTVWNDPVFMECSQQLSLRLLTDDQDEAQRIEKAFVLCFARLPQAREIEVVRELLASSREIYGRDKSLAEKTTAGIKLPKRLDQIEFSAWTSLARALINLDEFITRP